jgi:hypothetical protein
VDLTTERAELAGFAAGDVVELVRALPGRKGLPAGQRGVVLLAGEAAPGGGRPSTSTVATRGASTSCRLGCYDQCSAGLATLSRRAVRNAVALAPSGHARYGRASPVSGTVTPTWVGPRGGERPRWSTNRPTPPPRPYIKERPMTDGQSPSGTGRERDDHFDIGRARAELSQLLAAASERGKGPIVRAGFLAPV